MIMKPTGISPNNISLDSSNPITISWRNTGDRQFSYQVKIHLNIDNSLTYDSNKITSYNTFHTIPVNMLSSSTYKFTITVWNQLNESATSDWIIFDCSSTPTCSFANITDEGEILNNSYKFIGEYSQIESVPIKSWTMILYDSAQDILGTTGIIYSDTIEYEFSGLNNEDDYYIELQVRSQKDLIATSGKIHFTVRYAVPTNYISLTSENVAPQAAIRLSWNTTQIIGEVLSGSIAYIDDDKVDLRNGVINFKDGVPNFFTFVLKTWLSLVKLINVVTTETVSTAVGNVEVSTRNGTTELLRLHCDLGDIWLEFIYESDTEGRFHLWKNLYNKQYHIFSDLYNPSLNQDYYVGIKFDGKVCDLYTEAVIA